jgi:AraC family transcriptional regulator, regulatory protein of adaptative response / methylated-DNA-[protein]-cysteine methyltransferase
MQTNLSFDPTQLWQQVLDRDPKASFIYAVASTGIFCRPSCPSRRPAQHNVLFFDNAAGAMAAGYRACKRCTPLGTHPEAAMVSRVCRYLYRRRDQVLTLAELGKLANSSPFTVQRTFRRVLGISPRQYQAQLRANELRRGLTGRRSVTDAIYRAGYSSSSRVYENAKENLGMSPTRFRNGGREETIRFATTECALGLLMVAATPLGLCSVLLGDVAGALEEQLRQQFPEATIVPDPGGLKEYVSTILAGMSDHPASRDLPLDIRGTSFQARVWQALKQIPRGETRTYAEVAQQLGQPTAIRAVARACASNPVAIAIPCHRVIGRNGAVTGYRWGIERKRRLLEMERSS